MSQNMQDTEIEWARGTIISQVPDEWAFIYRVKLDDGREVQAIIFRHNLTPERLPRAGDRVLLTLNDGLCVVWPWGPMPDSQAPAPNPSKNQKSVRST